MPIIKVNHVTKECKLGQLQSLKTTALNQWRRFTGQPIEERAPFKTLDDVNLSIEPDEVRRHHRPQRRRQEHDA
jgi:ABC-type polysaccharide/polyol phosphate transport system ATPase subunit